MHARDLVEVAVIAVTRAEQCFAQAAVSPAANRTWNRYWTVNRFRLDHWNRLLAPEQQAAGSRSVRPVAEEILISEILTRVWTAIACLSPDPGRSENGPITQNVFQAHQEARNRVLKLLAHPELLSSADAVALNRLRRRCERWTDLLLAYLSQHGETAEFAFDAQRLGDFADDLREDGVFEGRADSWLLLLASLRNAFQQGCVTASVSGDLNQQLAGIIIRSLPPGDLGQLDLPGGMWQIRLDQLTSETEDLVGQLFALDDLPPSASGEMFHVKH